jgi:hypothetical protein
MPEITTKLSRGSLHKDYDDALLSAIRKQLKFKNIQQLLKFIDCTFKKDDYIKLLNEQGLLN